MSESGPGRPSSDSTDTDKDSSVECPACGDEFRTKRGMKSHHAQIHGESIAGVERECQICGETFKEPPSDNSKFCGRDCYAEYRRGNFTGTDHWQSNGGYVECENCGDEYYVPKSKLDTTRFCSGECQREVALRPKRGEENPMYKPPVEIECEWCNSKFEVNPSDAEDRRFCDIDCKTDWFSDYITGENHPNYDPNSHVNLSCVNCGSTFQVHRSQSDRAKYCSKDCMNEYRSENWVGENNPLYIDSGVECEQCGDEFQKRPAKIEMHDRHFCSRSCHGEWLSENNRGENHPRWEGGKVDYGEDWYDKRREALDRDKHTCQDCGKHRSEVKRIHVHHIFPRRDFDTPEEANKLINLVTLCISCHHKWEGLYLRPDTRE